MVYLLHLCQPQCCGAILFDQAELASWPVGPVWLFRPRYPSFPHCIWNAAAQHRNASRGSKAKLMSFP